MSYGIFITLHSKTKCMIHSFNFILSCSALLSLNGVMIWLVLIKTLFLIQSLCYDGVTLRRQNMLANIPCHLLYACAIGIYNKV